VHVYVSLVGTRHAALTAVKLAGLRFPLMLPNGVRIYTSVAYSVDANGTAVAQHVLVGSIVRNVVISSSGAWPLDLTGAGPKQVRIHRRIHSAVLGLWQARA
jgi:hypothetical protein